MANGLLSTPAIIINETNTYTTSYSGSVAIPTKCQRGFINAYRYDSAGIVLRWGYGYVIVYDLNMQPISNTEVSITFIYSNSHD